MFYKIALLFKGALTEEEANTEYTKVVEVLKVHGNIAQEIKPNKIGLAYPIVKSTEAYFATIKFEPAEDVVVDFKDWFMKINVLRVLITKNDNLTVEKVAGFSPIIKAVEEEVPEIPVEVESTSELEASTAAEETIAPVAEVETTMAPETPEVESKKEPEVDMNALDEKLEELLK